MGNKAGAESLESCVKREHGSDGEKNWVVK